MSNVILKQADGTPVIGLIGRIDSNNAPAVEAEIQQALGSTERDELVIDAEELEYISSAGLRVILHLRKTHKELSIINVKPEVYEVLDMTGFTEMMPVRKAYRQVSIEGCEVIGKGANGTLYRIDKDNVVKVYHDADALEDIQHERETARLALVLGIPTAISYDVVRVGDSYGSVFEFLNARSFSKLIAEEPDKLDWCVQEYVELLKKIHDTRVKKGALPDMRDTALGWAKFMKDYLPEAYGDKLLRLFEAVPEDLHMIHGDYHTKNLVLQNDEVLLIDMDTLAVGNRIFELGSMFNAYIGFSEMDHEEVKRFQGFDQETANVFWRKSLELYLGTTDEEKIREVEDKARIVGYTRMIRRSIRRHGLEIEAKRIEIDHWKAELMDLLDRYDTLLFSVNELTVEAKKENLQQVIDFVDERLEKTECPMKAEMQIDMAVEEIFVNIASYAYANEDRIGKAVIRVETLEDPLRVVLTFMDNGMPYDPLAKEDPDVTLSADQREIGGLGIFLVKNTMDDVAYEYKDGKNILTIRKNL
ncbi:MAG: anti-sigma factor antagonist [Lachnospiraceae bacterium]|nr:anti-sigma factor antagonist [Lachnospiraceae bacterium]